MNYKKIILYTHLISQIQKRTHETTKQRTSDRIDRKFEELTTIMCYNLKYNTINRELEKINVYYILIVAVVEGGFDLSFYTNGINYAFKKKNESIGNILMKIHLFVCIYIQQHLRFNNEKQYPAYDLHPLNLHVLTHSTKLPITSQMSG